MHSLSTFNHLAVDDCIYFSHLKNHEHIMSYGGGYGGGGGGGGGGYSGGRSGGYGDRSGGRHEYGGHG